MAGTSNISGLESITFTDNMSFDGTERGGAMTTNGQLWIGSTAARHVKLGQITSPLGTLTIGYSSPNITIDLAGGGSAVETLTGNSGGAISPTANNINTVGTGSITIAGAGSTLTTQLTGLTNHSVLVGAGTATITKLTVGTNGQVLIGSTAADPVFGTLTSSDSSITFTTGAGTLSLQVAGGTTVGKTITGDTGGALSPTAGNWNLLGSGSITTAGSGSTLTTQLTGMTNHAVLVGAGTTTLTKLAVGTNGQVLIGATGADPAFATITSSGGTISFTLGANTLNMETVNGGFVWNNVTGTSATAVKSNGYQANNAGLVTITMPSVASSTFGDTIKIAGLGAGGWLLQCVATQLIHFGSSATSAAGSIASTNRYDSLEIVCSSTTTEWFVVGAQGNLTVA